MQSNTCADVRDKPNGCSEATPPVDTAYVEAIGGRGRISRDNARMATAQITPIPMYVERHPHASTARCTIGGQIAPPR